MDKTEKLIDWEENERKDRNRDGIDDRIEPMDLKITKFMVLETLAAIVVTILFIGPSHPCELPVAMRHKYKVTGPASTGERPR